jgi:hypothetical protein
MIEHIWSILCNGASIDSETNSVRIFDALEQLTVYTNEEAPITLPIHFEIISLWIRSNELVPSKGKMQVFFSDSSNECKNQAELEIDLSQAIYFRTRVKADGLQLKGPGRYKFIVELKQEDESGWEKVASIPLLVSYQSISVEEKEMAN